MRLSIDLNQSRNVVNEMKRQKNSLNTYKDSVKSVKSRCGSFSNSRMMPIGALNQIIKEMNDEINDYNKLSDVLSKSIECYRDYESKIAGCYAGESNVQGDSNGEVEESGLFEIIGWTDIWNLVGSAGIIGNTISAIGSFFTGDSRLDGIIDSGGFITKIIGNAIEASNAGSNWLKHLVGLNYGFDGIDIDSPNSAFNSTFKKDFIDDLSFGKNATGVEKASVISKWAGHVLTLADNGLENYNEFKNQGTDGIVRGTAETILETGTDILLGTAATAVVSAAAVAIGITSAPAIAIGAGAAVVVAGANAVCKWACGKDIGEYVADTVCDFVADPIGYYEKRVENAIETVENIGETIFSGVSSAWNGLCGLFA